MEAVVQHVQMDIHHQNTDKTDFICDAGYYKDGSSCTACPDGKYSQAGSQSESDCTNCPNGSYCKDGGKTTCPIGSYCPAGSASPTLCPKGKCQYYTGSYECWDCGTGMYQDEEGQKECKFCKAGYYQNEEGKSDCKLCPAGSYCPEKGQKEPIPCADDEYSESGSSSCIKCSTLTGKYYCYNHQKTLCLRTTVNEEHTSCTGESTIVEPECGSSGIYYNGASCVTCDKGYYCPENDSDRYACGLNETTLETGSTSEEDCVCDSNSIKNADGSCKKIQNAVLTCATIVKGNGRKTIAACEGCKIKSGSGYSVTSGSLTSTAYVTDASQTGTFTITAEAMTGFVFVGSSTCTASIVDDSSTVQTCCFKDSSGAHKYGSTDKNNCIAKYIDTTNNVQYDMTESLCLSLNKRTCCYIANLAGDSGMTYHFGEVSADRCDKDSNNITTAAVCEAKNNACSISVSTTSVSTSVDVDNIDNSYYVVNVNLSGYGCKGKTVKHTATNEKNIVSRTHYVNPSNYFGSDTYSFTVYPKNPCEVSTATAEITGYTPASISHKIKLKTDWVRHDGYCVQNPDYTSFLAADKAGVNHYYSDLKQCTSGGKTVLGYTVYWTREDGCGSGGQGVDPTYACYGNATTLAASTKVDWLTGPSGELIHLIDRDVNGIVITSAAQCKVVDIPQPACYGNATTFAASTKVDWLTEPTGEYQHKLHNVILHHL